MIYKLVSLAFAVPAIPIIMVFAKSTSIDVTSGRNFILSLCIMPSLLWAFFTVINVLHWWAVAAIPVLFFASAYLQASFVLHVLRSGGSLLDAQFGYGLFMMILTLCSIAPYAAMWLDLM